MIGDVRWYDVFRAQRRNDAGATELCGFEYFVGCACRSRPDHECRLAALVDDACRLDHASSGGDQRLWCGLLHACHNPRSLHSRLRVAVGDDCKKFAIAQRLRRLFH